MTAATTRKPAFQASPTNPNIQEIQTEPDRRPDMPYAPAIRVESPCGLLFISGATPSPLYHKHPHVITEHDHPNRIEDQIRRCLETVKSILEHEGLTFTDVVKITKYMTDIRDQDGMVSGAEGVSRQLDAGQHDCLRQPALHAGRPHRTRRDRRVLAGQVRPHYDTAYTLRSPARPN